MTLPLAPSLLAALPDQLRGEVGLWTFDASGAVVARAGHDDGFAGFNAVGVQGTASRGFAAHPRHDGGHVVLTFPHGARDPWVPVLEAMIEIGLERQRLEVDLESMSASSLGLLEEIAMVGELMSELSSGETEEAVVERGLLALLVGAAAERAIFVRFDPARDVFEPCVHAVYDDRGRRGRVVPFAGDPVIRRAGLVARAAERPGSVVLDTVVDAVPLGPVGTPEGLVRRQVLAAAVAQGNDQNGKLFGVLMLIDKRATTYSSITTFGSHETKMMSGLASMLAAVLGARQSAALGKELEMATTIQQQILPARAAAVSGYDLAGRCETSGMVGGDYFDFLPMGDGRTLCVVADVSGHNLASGMLMVGLRASLRVLATQVEDLAHMFDELGDAMFTDLNRTERFVTAAGAVLQPEHGRVEVVNAGHNDTLVYRAATRSVERVASRDTILGFMAGSRHATEDLELRTGDVLVLYTDGVTEATNGNGDMFGEERLARVIARGSAGSAAEILAEIYFAVQGFSHSRSGGDDVTAIVVKRVEAAEDATR